MPSLLHKNYVTMTVLGLAVRLDWRFLNETILVETSKKIRKEITILVDSSAPCGRYTLNSKHNVELYKRFI